MTRAKVGAIVCDCAPALALFLLLLMAPCSARGQTAVAARDAAVAVGAQYDSTHVYVAPGDLAAFVKSVNATFGGQASKVSVTDLSPGPSSTEFQYVWTPAGTMSVFAFLTPIPFAFGLESTGYLVTDGHLRYPFGHEITGYEVRDLAANSEKAKGAGVKILSAPCATDDGRMSAIVEFPGGYIAEIHSVAAH